MIQKFRIGNIPAILYGAASEGVYLYIHGQHSCKEAAETFATVACQNGWQVLSIDLPEHGERNRENGRFFAWEVIPELMQLLDFAKAHWEKISLRAHSIGAYFSILSYQAESFCNVQFVSPILDMQQVCEDLMQCSNITTDQLYKEKVLPAVLGQKLYWDEYLFALEHPTEIWMHSTDILYGENDNLTHLDTVTRFAEYNQCHLSVAQNCEHWFHTEEQLTVLAKWTIEKTPKI